MPDEPCRAAGRHRLAGRRLRAGPRRGSGSPAGLGRRVRRCHFRWRMRRRYWLSVVRGTGTRPAGRPRHQYGHSRRRAALPDGCLTPPVIPINSPPPNDNRQMAPLLDEMFPSCPAPATPANPRPTGITPPRMKSPRARCQSFQCRVTECRNPRRGGRMERAVSSSEAKWRYLLPAVRHL